MSLIHTVKPNPCLHHAEVSCDKKKRARQLQRLHVKPGFGCSLRTRISAAFSSVDVMTAQAWSDTVRALSALSLRKPKIHTNVSEGEENLCPFCYNDDALQSADRFHSFYSIGVLRRHINKARSPATTSLSPVNCPYVECKTMLEQAKYLKSHLATVHSLSL